MNPTNDDYIISAFSEALVNDVPNRVTWEALSCATGQGTADGWKDLRGKKFDGNIQAAEQSLGFHENHGRQ